MPRTWLSRACSTKFLGTFCEVNGSSERAQEVWPGRIQFRLVRMRENLQQPFTALRDMKDHLAVIGPAARAADEPLGFEAVGKLDGGVMQNLQALGEYANGRLLSAWQALECEQRLMLMRLDPSRAGCLLAEIQKTADLVAEFRQHFKRIAPARSALHAVNYYIVIRY